jgi:hypothetical protein
LLFPNARVGTLGAPTVRGERAISSEKSYKSARKNIGAASDAKSKTSW